MDRLRDDHTPDGLRDDSMTLRVDLLGRFSVQFGGRMIPDSAFPRRKAMSLVKLLALQPSYRLHREQVLDLLWPELEPTSASAQLYKAVHHARQAFATVNSQVSPEAILSFQGELLCLSAPGGISTDVAEFEDLARRAVATRDTDLLRQASTVYAGDLLPGDLYEEWTFERRTALRDTVVDVLVTLGEISHLIGALAEAVDALRQAIVLDVTRERAHRLLMLVYARQGNRVRALRQFQVCAQTIERELGTSPSTETVRLYRDILSERIQQVETRNHAPVTDLTRLPPLAGRRRELHVIAASLDRLARGYGAVLVIEGYADIGKTRLAQEVLRSAQRRHAHVLFGSASSHVEQIPYLPFVEALRHALWANPNDADLIPAELAHAIPEIPATAAPISMPDRLASQGALFAGVLRFLVARAATAPVVLVLDDLHAADEGALKLFHYLARETAHMPLLLVGTWRPNEPGTSPAVAHTINDLERRELMHRMSVTPLSEDEHRVLVDQVLDSGRIDALLAETVYRRTEGNPLFAREMTRQLVRDGRISQRGGVWRLHDIEDEADVDVALAIPRSLHDLVMRRQRQLSDDALQLVQLAALIGRDIEYSLLEHGWRTSGSEDVALLNGIEEALSAGLLVESGFNLRFPHPLLREAIYEQMSQPRRRMLHGTVAAALIAVHPGTPDTWPVDSIAYHLRQAGDSDRATFYLIQAGDQAERVYDHDGALRRYGEARSLLTEHRTPDHTATLAEVLERIGDVERATGDVDRSLATYRAALEILDRAGTSVERQRRFTLHRKIALGAILTVNMPVAAEHLTLARAVADLAPTDQARLLIAESLYGWHALQFEAAIDHAARALEIAEQADAGIEANQACEMLAIAHMPLGNWQESLRYELRRRTPDWSPDIVVAIDAHLCLYQYALHNEDSLHQVQRFIETVAEQSQVVGNLRCLAVCHFVLGNLALLQGKPAMAAEGIARSLELHEGIGSPAGVAYCLARQAELLTAAGQYESVPRVIQRGFDVAQNAVIRDHCLSQLYTAGIRNRLEADDPDGATEFVRAAVDHDNASGPCAVCQVDLHEALADYYLTLGDLDTAQTYIDGALHVADFAQNGPGRARLVRILGRIHLAHEEREDAERCFSEAATIFQEVGDRYDLARTWQALSDLHEESERSELLQQADKILAAYRARLPAAPDRRDP